MDIAEQRDSVAATVERKDAFSALDLGSSLSRSSDRPYVARMESELNFPMSLSTEFE